MSSLHKWLWALDVTREAVVQGQVRAIVRILSASRDAEGRPGELWEAGVDLR